MKITTLVAGATLLALSACGNMSAAPGAVTPPVANAGGSASSMPQSANSLPAGDRVNAPIASPTGVVSSTRVGPR